MSASAMPPRLGRGPWGRSDLSFRELPIELLTFGIAENIARRRRVTCRSAFCNFFGWLDRSVPLASIYELALERIAVMDSAGYDAVWLAEHHFSGFHRCT